ncbi:putative peroxisomal biogenesis AAA ATPase pex1 [Mycena sanguinolenta]|uniref:Peroxisomal ATPase PEX1 n=1 Tax=Mycena sanguinolenta TaxID=230812 RepID=A0A8H6ZHZ8_9AGAR|nr:putative peroxisomal biogenesis AAA ATPase pex1 [Mycena sanguinolenta]
MPRRARVHFVSLRSSLVNLPISLYGPLVERSIRPQHLAVHLTLLSESPAEKLEVYVGWTGMASASSIAQFNSVAGGEKGFETIEIDPQYALGLGLKQNDLVEIGLVHDLPLATSVATEPLTPDDWEIIDIHASHVEATLLSQVRVAKMGQEMDVWVLGRTRVRLKVVSIQPESKGTALLLSTNTEVSIAPKLHARKQQPPQVNGAPKATAPAITPNDAFSVPQPPVSTRILRVLPPHLLAIPFPEHTGAQVLAYVSPATFTSLFHFTSADTDGAVYHKTFLERLSPPADPSAPPTAPPSPPVTRVLQPGAGAGAADVGPTGAEEEELSLYVRPVDEVPENHVSFGSSAGIEEWDLVRLSRPSDKAHIRVEPSTSESKAQMHSPSSPPTTFLAGVDDILTHCSQFCVRKFAMHASVNVVHGMSALLVTGRSGAGKTSIVQAVAKTLQQDPRTFAYTLPSSNTGSKKRAGTALRCSFSTTSKSSWAWRWSTLTRSAPGTSPSSLCLLYSASARSAAPNSRGVVLLATASSTAVLHPVVNGAHIFEDVVSVKAPNKNARKEILARIVDERLRTARDMQLDPEAPLNYAHIATQTEGYSATDLQDLVAQAVHRVAVRASDGSTPPLLANTDFDAAQQDFVPLSLRGVKLQKSSEVSWSDIGGLRETRRVLRETLEWPTKYGPIFAQSPLRLRSGLLLYGFPGCGKTLLASAVAKECGLNFISVKGPEILNKYIGASEQSVRDLFERATAAKPCVLFFDEFDSIAPKRGHDSTGVTDRVVNQMLTQMDGAEGLDGVYVLAATSRPDLIDSALLRPGRLDKSLLCDMPDLEDRKDILQAVARKVTLSPSVDIDEIAAATAGYSGADLQALLYNAHLEVVHSSIASTALDDRAPARDDDTAVQFTVIGGDSKTKVTSKADEMALQRRLRQIQSNAQAQAKANVPKSVSSTQRTHEITSTHLRSVLKTMRPSVSAEERARLDRIYRGFISDRSGDLAGSSRSGRGGKSRVPYVELFGKRDERK